MPNLLPMTRITRKHIKDAPKEHFIELMNDERVGEQLPLLVQKFSPHDYEQLIKEKNALWSAHGYGPHAYFIDKNFAGWGGLQYENGETDFALILHPDFWGWGREIFDMTKNEAFEDMKLPSITALLPASRKHTRAITRLGFIEDGIIHVKSYPFTRYRLKR